LVRQAPTIPIVFTLVSDPVVQGFVSNLARPGGNITGFGSGEFSIGGKWIDLIRQVVPDLTHVAIIFNPDTSPQNNFLLDSVRSVAPSLGLEVTPTAVHDPAGLARAIESVSSRPHGALVCAASSMQLGVLGRQGLTVSRNPRIAVGRHFSPQL
jgi:putative ABC transport system substrate-binding protein